MVSRFRLPDILMITCFIHHGRSASQVHEPVVNGKFLSLSFCYAVLIIDLALVSYDEGKNG